MAVIILVPRPSIKDILLVRMRWPLPEKHVIVYLIACKPFCSLCLQGMQMKLDKPPSEATGTSATWLSLFARSDIEKSSLVPRPTLT